MRWWKRGLRVAVVAAAALFIAQWWVRAQVRSVAEGHIHLANEPVPSKFTGIVLGCRVREGDVSNCLEERLERALELYNAGTVQRLLLSGDHGRRGYDEVNTMKAWLVAHGVPLHHIFLDHAGFDTYDTMVRARDIFQVTDAVVISQAFHLPRAVYLARSVGIDAEGAVADPLVGGKCKGSPIREPLAGIKAWMNVTLGASPKFGGAAIPITGSPEASFDQPSDDAALRTEEE